ncbi:uncharacterized protein BYT42DRAFT_568288 [Radiomyces spectabilis]|uniref:uncharacterized protein n=1 Tax=Radiomyces spectabilis TaxID=64574 RepID=UPI00221E62C7|nr:uncharacterized protein BYT42DRAFT_568288 [Radiomyces spectabilis]KAI8379272.1 hypothetical protein BYT42DRAFT_568288 [Radiomyces spectabilis]
MKPPTISSCVLLLLLVLQFADRGNTAPQLGLVPGLGSGNEPAVSPTPPQASSSDIAVPPASSDPPPLSSVPATTAPSTQPPTTAPTQSNNNPIPPVVPSPAPSNNPSPDKPSSNGNPPTSPTSATPNKPAPSNNEDRPTDKNIIHPTKPSGKQDPSATDTSSNDTEGQNTSSPSASSSTKSKPENNGDKSNIATIAGSVVGGLVGLALIAGFLTWLNRHGGCASRTRRRNKHGFEPQNDDFAIGMTENAVPKLQQPPVGGNQGLDPVPPSPFQHARRFVPTPTNPAGYMNLTDDEYTSAYHTNSTPLISPHIQHQDMYHASPEMYQQHYSPYQPPAALAAAPMETWSAQHQPQPYLAQSMKPDTVEHKPNAV